MWQRGAGEAGRAGRETVQRVELGAETGLWGTDRSDRDGDELRFGQVEAEVSHAGGDTCYFVRLPWTRGWGAAVNERDVALALSVSQEKQAFDK